MLACNAVRFVRVLAVVFLSAAALAQQLPQVPQRAPDQQQGQSRGVPGQQPVNGANRNMRQPQIQNAPWNRDLLIRSSSDGITFGEASVFIERGGVPSLTKLADGRIVAAFQWFPFDHGEEAFDRVAVRISDSTGSKWGEAKTITVSGLPDGFQRPFDPTIVALPDGRLRLYYSCGPKPQPGPPENDANRNSVTSYSAISTDGINYTFEPGARFLAEGKRAIDCAVAQVAGTWHYIAPIGKPEDGAFHATSTDGLSFNRTPDISSVTGQNWTGNLIAVGNQLRFYGSSQNGIWFGESIDGIKWTSPSYTTIRGGDPGAAQTKTGQFLLVYVSESKRSEQNPFQKARPRQGGF